MGEAIKGGNVSEHVLGAVDPSPTAHSKLLYDHEKSVGIIQATREVKITPRAGSEFRTGDLLRIEIPTVDMLDTDNFAISFDLVIENGTNSKQLVPLSDTNWKYLANPSGLQPFSCETTRTYSTNESPTDPPCAPVLSDQRYGISTGTADAGDFPETKAGYIAGVRTLNDNRRLYNPIGSGTFCTTSSGVQKMWTRVVLKQGSITVEDKQRYNYLYSTLIKSQTPAGYRRTAGFINEGIREEGNQDQFLTSCAWSSFNNGKRYVIRPLLGLFDAGKALPTSLAGQFTLEFYFETPKNFLISSVFPGELVGGDAANESNLNTLNKTYTNYQGEFVASHPNADYKIKNVRAHCPFFVPAEEYMEKLMSKVQNGGLEIHYDTYTTHERTVGSHWAGAGHMNFQDRAVSLKGGFLILITDNDINDIRTDMAIFKSLGMEHYQWKIGSEYLPPQEVLGEEPNFGVGSAEAYVMLEKRFDRFGEINTHGEVDYWNFSRRIATDEHGIGVVNGNGILEDCPDSIYKKRRMGSETHHIIPLQLEKVPGMISGYNALASNTDIEFLYRLDSNGSAQKNASEFYSQPVVWPIRYWDTTDTKSKPKTQEAIFKSTLGDPYGCYGDMIYKNDPTQYHMYFFAHKDVLFVLKDLGSAEIRQ